MKKTTKFLMTSLIVTMSIGLSVPAFAYNVPDKIRVGLEYKYKEVSGVPINNSKLLIGVEYKSQFHEEAKITAKNGFTVSTPVGKTVDVNEFYGSYNEALEASQDILDTWGYEGIPAYTDRDLWGIYICDLSDSVAKSVANDVGGAVVNSSKLMVLLDGGSSVMCFNGVSPQFSATGNDGVITLGDRSYRGVVEFGRYKGDKITAVNVLSMNQYLYGTVPAEMPSSWHEEALKAQAVVARSYALTKFGSHGENGYDLCDNTNCQVYIGFTRETARTNTAVDDTEDVVACYEGKPINAVFSASSGGGTDNSENVWSGVVPYLKGVKEINEVGVATWTRTYTADEMRDILQGKDIEVGNILNVEITSTNKYGRVLEVTITGSKGSKVVKKEETRTLFSGTKEGSLPGRMYTINGKGGADVSDTTASSAGTMAGISIQGGNKTVSGSIGNSYVMGQDGVVGKLADIGTPYMVSKGNAIVAISERAEVVSGGENKIIGATNETKDSFVFVGKGNGHGVGMSQYGAKGMADLGYTYDEILKHYYTGITLE